MSSIGIATQGYQCTTNGLPNSPTCPLTGTIESEELSGIIEINEIIGTVE